MLHQRIAKILMLAFLIISTILPTSVVSAIMFFIPILIILNPLGNKNNHGFLYFIWPLLILIFIGSHGFLYNNTYDVLKDIWYIINPIAALIAGYLLMIYINDLQSLLKIIVIASVLVALIHLSNFIIKPELIHQSYIQIRNSSAGRGDFIVIMGLAVLIICQKEFPYQKYITNKPLFVLFFTVLVLSLLFSFSRTLILCFLLLICILWGVVDKLNKNRLIILSVSTLIIVFFFVDSNLNQFVSLDDPVFIN